MHHERAKINRQGLTWRRSKEVFSVVQVVNVMPAG
jgi:hypothetical protein